MSSVFRLASGGTQPTMCATDSAPEAMSAVAVAVAVSAAICACYVVSGVGRGGWSDGGKNCIDGESRLPIRLCSSAALQYLQDQGVLGSVSN